MSKLKVERIENLDSSSSAKVEDIIGHKLPFNKQIQYPAGSLGEAIMDSDSSDILEKLAANDGSSLIGHKGQTLEFYLNSLYSVSPLQFGAKGDGTTDDTAAIQQALDYSLAVDFGSSDLSYKVSSVLNLRSGHVISGRWPTITQTVKQTPLFNAVSKEKVSIKGLKMVGVLESPYVNSPSSQAIGIKAGSCKLLEVIGCIFENFCYSPLMVQELGDGVTFAFNVVKGPGAAILSDINYRNTTGFTIIAKNVLAHGNKVTLTASGGIIGQGSENVIISNNNIHDLITEHGLYCDTAIKNIVITGNTVKNTGTAGTGIKVQIYDSFNGECENVTITGNTIKNSGSDSILLINTSSGTPVKRIRGATISGNSITDSRQSGISIRNATGVSVTGNSITDSASDGIFSLELSDSLICDNQIKGSSTCGIFYGSGDRVKISENHIYNVGRTGNAPSNCGIYVNTSSNVNVSDNTILPGSTAQGYGVFIGAGDQSTMVVKGNTVIGSRLADFRFKDPVSPLAYFGDNIFYGPTAFVFEALQRGTIPHMYFGSAAPTTGTWQLGARVERLYPQAGTNLGWVCVIAGSPGAWKAYGSVSA